MPGTGHPGVGREQAERAHRPVLAHPAGGDQDAPQRGGLAAARVGRRDREPVARQLGRLAGRQRGRASPRRARTPGPTKADVVLDALRVQGWVWYSVLIADPEVSAAPSMGAWVQAGSSIARATAKITGVVLRRFWPLVLIALAVLGGLLALVIVNLSGASQVWASLVTVAAVIGASGVGVGSGVSSAFDGRRVRDLGGRQARRLGLEHHLAAGDDVDHGGAGPAGQPRGGRPANQEEPRHPVAARRSRSALASVSCRTPRTPTPPSGSRTSASASGNRPRPIGSSAGRATARCSRSCCRSPPTSRSRSLTSGRGRARPPGSSSTTTRRRTRSWPTSRRR